MNSEMAHFMFANMRNGRESRGDRPLRGDFSGAAIMGQSLFIATVKRDTSRRLVVLEECTNELALSGKDQGSTREFSAVVRAHFRNHNIRRLLLRRTSESRKYPAGRCAYVIEAILNLVEELELRIVDRATIDAWACRCRRELPRVPPSAYWKTAEYFQMAIDTACVAESWAREAAAILGPRGSN